MKEEIQAVYNLLTFGYDIYFGESSLSQEDGNLFIVSLSENYKSDKYKEFNDPQKAAKYFVETLYDLKYKFDEE